MKIALFSGNYNNVVDGPVRCLNRLVAFLEQEGHEVLVFAPTNGRPAYRHSGTLISVPSAPLPGGRGEYRLALGLPRKTRAILDDFAPDLFHLSAPDWLGHSAQAFARRRGAPIAASFHTRFDTYGRYYGGAWLEAYVTRLLTRFYNRCDRVYAPTDQIVRLLHGQGVTSELGIWSRGVDRDEYDPARRDMEWRRSLGIADDEVLVVFVGRLVLEKGLDRVAEVYDRMEASDGGPRMRMLVVGDGPERARLAARMPNAAIAGYLGGADLGRAYASADLFFNPSVTEGFGNVTLEAMASGLPTVCADSTGNNHLVEEGHTGLLARTRHADGYYVLLRALAGDPSRRSAMGALARAESESYDWDAVMRGLLDDYLELVSGGASPARDSAPGMTPAAPRYAQGARAS